MADHEHPFAPYVRTLGKGKNGSRSLTRDEAEQAMTMILEQQVTAEQVGAFLMLLRVKEESPEELSGFVTAVRAQMSAPKTLKADLDWSTYAGKKRQLPWFFLSALVLAEQGVRICMHGARGHTPGRLYIEDLLASFGLKAAHTWLDAEQDLEEQAFCYLPLGLINTELERLFNLRSILGLRSPVHTLSRLLNPLNAPYRIDAVFHPAYGPMHQQTAMLLGQNNSVTIRGEGGEAEIRPDADCTLQWVSKGEYVDQKWPRVDAQRHVRPESMDPEDLLRVWRGQLTPAYAHGAICETLAVCLCLLQRAESVDSGRALAQQLWQQRDKSRY
ncbi:MAG: anthranilate phosphoribosyltransferase [Motiliproteus sp.]|jgi:anthranilate phosphoribosyltransferase